MPHLKKYYISLLLVLTAIICHGQTLKPGVLVIGASAAGVSAAIQSAHSGVKTVLVYEGDLLNQITIGREERERPSGVLKDLLDKMETLQKYPLKSSQPLTPAYISSVLKSWTDTIKNLTILSNTSIASIKKSGKGWEVSTPKNLIKTDVLIDASADRSFAKKAAIKDTLARYPDSVSYRSTFYRTSVAIPEKRISFPAVLPAISFLSASGNLVYAAPFGQELTFSSGQAAGALASYCAFFKTNTDNLNLRVIQSELMTYRLNLIDFDDIASNDSNRVSFQQMALTGIIKGKAGDGKFLLMPDSAISTEDIRLPVKEYYSRSQIWFLDNRSDKITMEQLLSLIKFSAQRGAELNKEIEKGWKTSFKLPGKYEIHRPVTRREFCVLFNTYLRPFDVTINKRGVLKR